MASSPATSPPSPPGNDSVTPPPTSTTNSSSNSTSSSSPPPSASPPPSPPLSPPPSTPPPTESPPSPPPASSPPPRHDSSPPPPPSPTTHSPPPNSSSSSPPPSNSPTLSPPPPPSSTPSPSPPSPPATAPSTTTPTPPVPGSSSSPPPPPRSPSNTLSPPPPPPPLSPSTPSSSNSGSSPSKSSPSSSSSSDVAIIAGAAVAGVVVLAFIIVCLTCTRKKKKHSYYMETPRGPKGGDYYNPSWPGPRDHIVKFPSPPGASGPGSWGPPPPVGMSGEYSSPFSGPHHPSLPPPSPTMALGFSKSQFTYDELAAATGGFSEVNLLGQGGFGYVHKGVLPDGKEVAVKSLKSGSGQGEREFQAEVEIISRVHHRHLVSLVGYCIAGGQRMLVYEFVDNKTLEFHLHGKDQPVMDWATRLRIAVGSAKGLAYLHEDCHPRIIHRDIKAANILLDFNYEAMVADFGLAKLSSDNYTHVSTRVMGTFGYLAPEYASSGKLSEKSDVFSFGVMLLELITGRKPVDFTNKLMEDSLVDWARPLLTKATEDGDYDELVDPRLEGNYARQELTRMAACAAASIRHSARRRPRMSQIVRALDGDASLDDLNEAPKPSPSPSSANISGMNTSAYDTGAYNADMMKFRKMVLSSQDEFGGSSEYERTGEFGLRASPSSNDSRDMGHSGVQRQRL